MQLACWFCLHVISLFFFSFFGICVKLDNSFSHSSRSDLVGATLCNFVQHESVFRCCGKVKQKAKTSSSQTSCTDTIKVKLHSSHLIYLHHRILPPLVAASDASIAVLAAAGIVVAADSVAVVGAALKKKQMKMWDVKVSLQRLCNFFQLCNMHTLSQCHGKTVHNRKSNKCHKRSTFLVFLESICAHVCNLWKLYAQHDALPLVVQTVVRVALERSEAEAGLVGGTARERRRNEIFGKRVRACTAKKNWRSSTPSTYIMFGRWCGLIVILLFLWLENGRRCTWCTLLGGLSVILTQICWIELLLMLSWHCRDSDQ